MVFVAGSSCSIMVPVVFTSPFQMQLQNQKREGGEEEENEKKNQTFKCQIYHKI